MMETKDKLRALSKKKPLKNNPEEKSWKKNLQKSLKHSKKSLKNSGKNDVIKCKWSRFKIFMMGVRQK